MSWNGHPGRAFHKVKGTSKAPRLRLQHPSIIIAIDMSTEPEMCFVAELSIIKVVRILCNFHEPTARDKTFFFFMSAGVILFLICVVYEYS